ncbi:MAG: 8-amino-7-oxononanoate synthase [Magnetospirillum sp.]|nr:8-amino-7-oxononanoate synthase [Magnetospirillum sp.]
MRDLDDRLNRFLDTLAAGGRRRRLRAVEPLDGGRARIDGREVVNFSANDYLGLSRHPLLIERARAWASRYGAGSGASRLVTGHLAALEALEGRIAAAKGTEAALVFASGWQCNASVLPALLDKALWGEEPAVFADRLNHASLHMGCQAAGVRQQRFRHNDLAHLADLLERHGPGPKLVVTESVFSMDGDLPDVAALARLCVAHDALLYLDEAHATGILGPTGFGLSVGLDVDVAMGTFSKAMGSFGAYVACSAAMREYLINRASGLIYATALPPAVLGAIDAAIELVPSLEPERRRVAAHAATLRRELAAAGLDTGESATQIVPVILGDEQRTLAAAAALEERGLLGIAIRPPTVPPGTSRIRFALSAVHSAADIERLAAATIAVTR